MHLLRQISFNFTIEFETLLSAVRLVHGTLTTKDFNFILVSLYYYCNNKPLITQRNSTLLIFDCFQKLQNLKHGRPVSRTLRQAETSNV